MKYINGLIDGKWIVDFDWIKSSLSRELWLAEHSFEVAGDEKCHLQIPKKFRTQEELLFQGYFLFFYGEFHSPSMDELSEIVEKCGATILKTLDELKEKIGKRKVHVICDASIQNSFETGASILKKFKPILSTDWILDSISWRSVQDVKYYIAL